MLIIIYWLIQQLFNISISICQALFWIPGVQSWTAQSHCLQLDFDDSWAVGTNNKHIHKHSLC